MRTYAATPDVVVGSVHAATEDGHLVVASEDGEQLGPYSYTAGMAVWVVGAQKVVPSIAAALRRIETYSYPLEDNRSRALRGRPVALSKILIVSKETSPGRAHVVLVREPIGF
ncbi:LUD domain-containing protein [Saccharopolyspora sp. NPDC050389]|uniref:LUD domain-containing protein n=1 Tax=Saccharopolyspora sp. NPDC050389 TaxID=3155516 RepID=UPI0033FE0E80